jgi:hypothetical protein
VNRVSVTGASPPIAAVDASYVSCFPFLKLSQMLVFLGPCHPPEELTRPACRYDPAGRWVEQFSGVDSMSTTLFDLSSRTAHVTGGNMGLGKAMARALAKARKLSDLAVQHHHL